MKLDTVIRISLNTSSFTHEHKKYNSRWSIWMNTEWVSWEGISRCHLVQPSCSCKATETQLARTMPSWLLNISKDDDSTTSLAKQRQCSAILTVKNVSWCSEGASCICFCPLPLVLSLWSTAKTPALHSFHPPSTCLTCTDQIPPEPSPGWTVCAFSALPHMENASPLITFVALLQSLSSVSLSFVQGVQDRTQQSKCGPTRAA